MEQMLSVFETRGFSVHLRVTDCYLHSNCEIERELNAVGIEETHTDTARPGLE